MTPATHVVPLPLTQALAHFVAAPPWSAVPEDLGPILRDAFVDTAACILGGRDETLVQALLGSHAGRAAGASPCRLLFGEQRGAPAEAAFINAAAGHALDFDDMALAGHPSVVLVPALLAAAADASDANGAALLRAYLVGYEVWAELARREPDALHGKGWHPTGVLGTVAAAAAVASLTRLTPPAAGHALGIAASLAGGLVGNFGSMTKPLHAGWAARHGVQAVQLARAGITAAADALEGPAGLLAALSPRGRVDLGLVAMDGREPALRTAGLSIKKYPVCYAVHRLIDATLDLRSRHGFTAAEVQAIEAALSETNLRVLRHHRPADALQAKFSLEFACAMAVLDGAVGVRQLADHQLERTDLAALMARVEARPLTADCPLEPNFARHDRVRITLTDGRVLDSGDVRFARGHTQAPLGPGELQAKFMGCLRPGEDAAGARLLRQLQQLGESPAPLDWVLERPTEPAR